MKLKMWIGNLDGVRQGLVVATSKARATKVARTGRIDFDNYWVEQPEADNRFDVEVLYTRPFDHTNQPPPEWTRGRCPIK